MSLLKTKPRWCAFAEAAENGWINGNTGELLVSIRGLKSKLEAEMPTQEVLIAEEIKEVEVVKEQTTRRTRRGQRILAEVVEYQLDDKEVIGE